MDLQKEGWSVRKGDQWKAVEHLDSRLGKECNIGRVEHPERGRGVEDWEKGRFSFSFYRNS